MGTFDGFVFAADMNPGTAGGDDVLGPTANSPSEALRRANSNNHAKTGQNVLYRGGHVAWNTTPFCGYNDDNIYTTRDGKIAASPYDIADSILLPLTTTSESPSHSRPTGDIP